MIDKEKEKAKLLKLYSRWGTEKCFICGKELTKEDIEKGNFEKVDKRYIHTSCFDKHITR